MITTSLVLIVRTSTCINVSKRAQNRKEIGSNPLHSIFTGRRIELRARKCSWNAGSQKARQRSPARVCSRDGKLCYSGRLEYDFLAFVPCFLLSLFSPSLSRHVSHRVPTSVQQSSATLQQVVRVFSSCVVCILPHLANPFVFICWVLFRSSCFLGDVFVVNVLEPATLLALDLPILIISRLWFSSVSLSVTTELVSV